MQRIQHPDGYIIPLSIQNGLPYMDMHPPSDHELDTYLVGLDVVYFFCHSILPEGVTIFSFKLKGLFNISSNEDTKVVDGTFLRG